MSQDWISHVFEWAYLLAWSVSFYPQILLNHQRRSYLPINASVKGLSIDYVFLNELGFLCYAIYTLAFFANPFLGDQYRGKWHSNSRVQLYDAFFAVHALLLTTIILIQTVWYSKSQGVSRITWLLIAITILTSIHFGITIATNVGKVIDYLYFLWIMKTLVTIVKFAPQVYLNYVEKSTRGWSNMYVFFDFTSRLFLLARLFYNSSESGWIESSDTHIQIGLGFVSIFFDTIFCVQYYCLYPADQSDEFDKGTSQVKFVQSNDQSSPIFIV